MSLTTPLFVANTWLSTWGDCISICSWLVHCDTLLTMGGTTTVWCRVVDRRRGWMFSVARYYPCMHVGLYASPLHQTPSVMQRWLATDWLSSQLQIVLWSHAARHSLHYWCVCTHTGDHRIVYWVSLSANMITIWALDKRNSFFALPKFNFGLQCTALPCPIPSLRCGLWMRLSPAMFLYLPWTTFS